MGVLLVAMSTVNRVSIMPGISAVLNFVLNDEKTARIS
jgi:hypothetical protein